MLPHSVPFPHFLAKYFENPTAAFGIKAYAFCDLPKSASIYFRLGNHSLPRHLWLLWSISRPSKIGSLSPFLLCHIWITWTGRLIKFCAGDSALNMLQQKLKSSVSITICLLVYNVGEYERGSGIQSAGAGMRTEERGKHGFFFFLKTENRWTGKWRKVDKGAFRKEKGAKVEGPCAENTWVLRWRSWAWNTSLTVAEQNWRESAQQRERWCMQPIPSSSAPPLSPDWHTDERRDKLMFLSSWPVPRRASLSPLKCALMWHGSHSPALLWLTLHADVFFLLH